MWDCVKNRIFLLCLLSVCLVWWVPCFASADEVSSIAEKSGAGELYGSLDKETQELLSQMGVEEGQWSAGEDVYKRQATLPALNWDTPSSWWMDVPAPAAAMAAGKPMPLPLV